MEVPMPWMQEDEIVRAICHTCGGGRTKHRVVYDYVNDGWDKEDSDGRNSSQIIECMGCEDVRYRDFCWSRDDIDPATGKPKEYVMEYPAAKKTERSAKVDLKALPPTIRRIYAETIRAYGAGAATLTAAGLRAIVEALCLEQGVTSGNTSEKN
jgi:hypothetical protein